MVIYPFVEDSMSFDRDYYSLFSFVIQTQLSLMARRGKYGHLPFFRRLNVFRSRLLQSPLPSIDNQVRWHAETNMVIYPFARDLMSFNRDYYSLLFRLKTIKSDGTQRQICSSALLLETQCLLTETITVYFVVQRQSSPMARRDKYGHLPLWSETQCLSTKTITVSFAIQRQSSSRARRDKYGHLPFYQRLNVFQPRLLQSPFTIQRQLSPMACRDHHGPSLLLFPETILVSFTIQRQSSPMVCRDHHGHSLFIIFKTILVSFVI